ncbi:MAG: hypothetical protein GX577_00280 [Leptolinea sp.]|nr:hypothetical protein [Leptolinea sp.]
MRTFYTESDIDDLAASGVQQLEVGQGVVLTDAARERAEELGIVLVIPGSAPTAKAAAIAAPVLSAIPPSRPQGCQHEPFDLKSNPVEAARSGGPVVDQLVEAVSALKKRGG